MDEMAEIRKRFGDEQSNLLDHFERMSFQTHLNRAMLPRSFSEPSVPRSRSHSRLIGVAPVIHPLVAHQVNQGQRRRGKRGSGGFHKILKKLLRPILGRKAKEEAPDPKHPLSWKSFSRSLRF